MTCVTQKNVNLFDISLLFVWNAWCDDANKWTEDTSTSLVFLLWTIWWLKMIWLTWYYS